MNDSKRYVDIDTGHEYDGIRELDNHLPNWWLTTLWGAVFFGTLYWLYGHSFGAAPTMLETLAMENAAAEAAMAVEEEVVVVEGQPAPSLEQTLTQLATDQAVLAKGKTTFEASCAPCHRKDGGGMVGPNLTDDYFIHGGKAEDTYKVVAEGILAKGMPAWKSQLGATRTKEVVAYVLSLQQHPVTDGKAPEGDRMAAATAPPAEDQAEKPETPAEAVATTGGR